jgi:hypothetical protein
LEKSGNPAICDQIAGIPRCCIPAYGLGSVQGETQEDRKRRAENCLAAWVGEKHFVNELFVTLQTVIIHNARKFGGPFTLSKVSIVDIAIELKIISIYCFIYVACVVC